MIKVKNLKKSFIQKNKSTQVVLKGITLDFSESGFVMIVGASGAGKTTLLNTMCGLEKVTSGSIEFDSIVFDKYNYSKWDNLRNHEIGYIFQNYELFNNLSVSDNVGMTLTMLGITDKTFIDERIKEVLKVVDMNQYQNRLVSTLSGGQMQRVAIARALVKNPHVIIADEPTGNLDEKNSLRILEILKKISEDRLVVMVTHDMDFANFYATRIITLKDGLVETDEVNLREGKNLQLEDNQDLYLLDYTKEESLPLNPKSIIDVYNANDGSKDDFQIDIRMVIRGNTLYIDPQSLTHKIEIIDSKSSIQMRDAHQKKFVQLNEITENTQLSKLDDSLIKPYKYRFWEHVGLKIKELFFMKKRKNSFLIGFFIVSLMLVLSTTLYVGSKNPPIEQFQDSDKYLIKVDLDSASKVCDDKTFDYNDLEKYETNTIKMYPQITHPIEISLENYSTSYQLNERKTLNDIGWIPYTSIPNYKGVKPGRNEVVIDNMLFQKMLDPKSDFCVEPSPALIMNQTIYVNNESYKIVGTTNNSNMTIYCNPIDEFDVYSTSLDFDCKTIDKIQGFDDSGNVINTIDDTSCLIPLKWKSSFAIGSSIRIQVYNISNPSLKVVGYYDNASADYAKTIVTSKNVIRRFAFEAGVKGYMSYVQSGHGFCLYAIDSTDLVNQFKKDKIQYINSYENNLKEYESRYSGVYQTLLLVTLGFFILPLIFLLFFMRSERIKDIRNITIYRSLGMKRTYILQSQFSNIFTVFLISSLPGYIVGIILNLILNIKYKILISSNPLLLIGIFLFVFIMNVIVGMLPSISLINKTPHDLMAEYDI